MKFFLKTSFALTIVFLIGILLGNCFKPHTYMTPSNEACDVYEFIISNHSNQSIEYPTYINPITIEAKKSPFSSFVPNLFVRPTGEYEIQVSELTGEKTESPVYSEHYFDPSDFFKNVYSSQKQSLERCGFPRNANPKFHQGSFEALVLKANLTRFRYDIRPMMREFSIAGFSKDQQHVIIYVSDYCGGLCGQGGYFLLKKIDGQWTEFGYAMSWIS